jgi:hypothetical protein
MFNFGNKSCSMVIYTLLYIYSESANNNISKILESQYLSAYSNLLTSIQSNND